MHLFFVVVVVVVVVVVLYHGKLSNLVLSGASRTYLLMNTIIIKIAYSSKQMRGVA